MANVAITTAWVCLPNLPIEYYEPSFLQDIGKAIGPVLRIDTHTATKTKGRFVRLCIQISYDRPLIKLIKVEGIAQLVQYEGLSSLCFSCGHVGHREDFCPSRVSTSEMAGGDDANGEILKGKEAMPLDKSNPKSDNFEPWVLVARKKKFSKDFGKEVTQPSSFGHQGPSKTGLSQTLSPPRPKVVLSKAERSDGMHDHMTHTASNGPFTDRTTPLNGEDQSRLTQHHAPSKAHIRE